MDALLIPTPTHPLEKSEMQWQKVSGDDRDLFDLDIQISNREVSASVPPLTVDGNCPISYSNCPSCDVTYCGGSCGCPSDYGTCYGTCSGTCGC